MVQVSGSLPPVQKAQITFLVPCLALAQPPLLEELPVFLSLSLCHSNQSYICTFITKLEVMQEMVSV